MLGYRIKLQVKGIMFFKKKNSKASHAEKRKFERVDFMQSSYMKAKASTSSKPDSCWFNNISVGGINIDISDKKLQVGDEITVIYKIGIYSRTDSARVKRVQKAINNWRCGCEFTQADPKRDSIIKSYIEKVNMKG